MEILEFSVPIYVCMPTLKNPNKKWYLNLNRYRNAHHIILSQAKKLYGESLNIPEFHAEEILIKYVFYAKDRRLTDTRNVTTIVDKFLLDEIVSRGYIPDDNYKHVSYNGDYFGGVDSSNPRVDVTIKIIK